MKLCSTVWNVVSLFTRTFMTKESVSIAIKNGIKKANERMRVYRQTQKKKVKVNNIHQIEQHSSVFQLENQNFVCEMIDVENCEKEIEDECYFEESIEDLQFTENIFSNSVHIDEKNNSEIIERRIPSFDMKNLAKHLTLLSNKSSFVQNDDKKRLKENGNVSKGTLSRALHDWSMEYKVSMAGIDALMNILHNTFKDFDLPVKNHKPRKPVETLEEFKHLSLIQKEAFELESDSDVDEVKDEEAEVDENESICTEDLTSHVVKSAIHEYSLKSTRYVSVDQCQCDGYVYAGDNNQLFYCPECEVERFRPCSRTLCKGKGSHVCEHLRDSNGDGIAYKQLFYRPLLVLISDLLRTPKFLSALRYRRVQSDDAHNSATSYSATSYSDLMDGDVPQHHLSVMHSKYNTWLHSKPERLNNSEEVSLIFSEFYDGGQLFKSKSTNFWILMTQILNLPPTFRGKLGIGMFLSAIYSGRHMEAEKFLFTDMYCEELRLLNDGTELVLKGKRYFIQARLILHTLDTKALEAVVGLQSVGMSLYGCPLCRGVTGVQDGAKCVYIGHRQLLPQNSYLRFLGQSGKCCPAGFYDHVKTNGKTTDETYEHGFESVSMEDLEGYKFIKKEMQARLKNKKNNTEETLQEAWESVKTNVGSKYHLQFCIPCDGNKKRETAIHKFFFVQESLLYHWSHEYPQLYDPMIYCEKTGLRKVLIFRHFDLRPHKPYTRVTNSDHLKNAIQARELNEHNRAKSKKHSNGVQDVWSFARLSYANIANQVTWPFLHALTGVIKLLIFMILGAKEVKESIVTQTYADIINKTNNESTSSEDEYTDDDESNNDDQSKKEIIGPLLSKKETRKLNRDVKQAKFYTYRPLHLKSLKSGKHPFVCTTTDKKRCQEWLQCIILPKGLGEDSWDMRKFIINEKTTIPGFMKMNQRLKLISCFWDFILYAMQGVEEQYKIYYRMIGVNLAKLQSYYFKASDVEQLSRDIEEMVAMWEGVFPLKTCTFILHELIDLAPFIRHFGPPMGVSEFPGERAVGALINRKLKCNAGGVSFENMIADRHIQFELRKLKQFYTKNDLSELNGACTYSDSGECIYNGERYSIFKPESKTSQLKNSFATLSDYEIDLLIDALVLEVERKYGSDNRDLCIGNSTLYKLVEFQRRMKQHAKMSTSEWLRFVIKNEEEQFDIQEVNVAQNILSYKPSFFKNAVISGLLFQSRGSSLRETMAPKQVGYGSEKGILEGSISSRLQNNFRDKASNSSWCILKQQNFSKLYAQINTFFPIHIGDTSLDGLMVASVTCRTYSIIPKTNLVKITRTGSLDVSTLFVSTKDIYPTRIATIPFASQERAIKVRSRKQFHKQFSSTDRNAELKELIMFTLHPERLFFRFE